MGTQIQPAPLLACLLPFVLVIGCGAPPSQTSGAEPAAEQSTPSGPPEGMVAKCQAAAPQADFVVDYMHAVSAEYPATLNLVFRTRPSAGEAERILRSCLDAAIEQWGRETNVLATVWHSPTGQEVDEDQVPLIDGSSNLIFEAGKIMTWNEREAARKR